MAHALDVLRGLIPQRTVLFVGPTSMAELAGGPDSKTLLHEVANVFGGDLSEVSNLNELADQLASRSKDLDKVSDYIASRYANLPITPAIETLASFDWPIIFTLGYDDVLERAISQQGRRQPLAIFRSSQGIFRGDPRYAPVVHLRGGVENTGYRLPLGERDWTLQEKHWTWMLRHLEHYSGTCVPLLLGLSFEELKQDKLLRTILLYLKADRAVNGYAVVPEKKGIQSLVGQGIVDLQLDCRGFAAWLCEQAPTSTSPLDQVETLVVLDRKEPNSTHTVRLERRRWDDVRGKLSFVSQETLRTVDVQARPMDFFRGNTSLWQWYTTTPRVPVPRTLYCAGANNRTCSVRQLADSIRLSLLEYGSNDHNKMWSITAPQGNGRKVTIRMLASELVANNLPVAFLAPDRTDFHLQELVELISHVDSKPLIIVEDPSDGGIAAYTLFKELTGASVDADILFSWPEDPQRWAGEERLSAASKAKLELVDSNVSNLWMHRIRPERRFSLADHITDVREDLARRLKDAQVPRVEGKPLADIVREIQEVSGDNFFVTMLMYLDGENNHFRQIIKRKYESLVDENGEPTPAQRLYLLCCAFSSLGIPVLKSVARSYLDVSMAEMDTILTSDLLGLVTLQYRDWRNTHLKPFHGLIAKVIFDEYVKTPDRILQMLKDYGSHLEQEDDQTKRDVLHAVRVSEAAKEFLGRLTADYFEFATSIDPTDPILKHHLAKALKENQEFERCKQVLSGLLDQFRRNHTYHHTASENYLTWGRIASVAQGIEQAKLLLRKAVSHAEKTILYGQSFSTHGYQALVLSVKELSEYVQGDEKGELLGSALQTVEDGLDELRGDGVPEDDSELLYLESLRVDLLDLLGEAEVLLADLEATKSYAGKRGADDYVHGQLLYAAKRYGDALDILNMIPLSAANSQRVLFLKGKVLKKMGDAHRRQLIQVLEQLLPIYENLWVAFELAKALFIEGHIERSLQVWETSERLGSRRDPHRVRDYVRLANGKPRQDFVGVIEDPARFTDHRMGLIKSKQLKCSLRFDRESNPKINPEEHKGRPVEFSIAFTYARPLARYVRLVR